MGPVGQQRQRVVGGLEGQLVLELQPLAVDGRDLLDRHEHPGQHERVEHDGADHDRPDVDGLPEGCLDRQDHRRHERRHSRCHEPSAPEVRVGLWHGFGELDHRRVQGRRTPGEVGGQPREVEPRRAQLRVDAERRGGRVGHDQQPDRREEQLDGGVPPSGGGDQADETGEEHDVAERVGHADQRRHRGDAGVDRGSPEQLVGDQGQPDHDGPGVEGSREVTRGAAAVDQVEQAEREHRVRGEVEVVAGGREGLAAREVVERVEGVADHPQQLTDRHQEPRLRSLRLVHPDADDDRDDAADPDGEVEQVADQAVRNQRVAEHQHDAREDEPPPASRRSPAVRVSIGETPRPERSCGRRGGNGFPNDETARGCRSRHRGRHGRDAGRHSPRPPRVGCGIATATSCGNPPSVGQQPARRDVLTRRSTADPDGRHRDRCGAGQLQEHVASGGRRACREVDRDTADRDVDELSP